MIMNDDLFNRESLRVLREFQAAEENGNIEQVLFDNFQGKEMDTMNMIVVWRCRDYICKISDAFYEKNPSLFTYRLLVEVMRGNIEKTELMLKKLGQTPDELDITKMGQIDFIRMMFEIVLPSLSDEEFARRVNFLVQMLQQPIQGLALTACRPSVMNGFRDFSEFCLSMDTNQKKIQKIIMALYGGAGKGVYEVAHAEWKYEQGDSFGALVEVAGTIPGLEDENDMRCLFTAFILQMRILHFNGQTRTCVDMFRKIRDKMYDTGSEELEASLIAAEALYSCYKGDLEFIETWLEKYAPNENDEIFMMDMFPYFVKMRCYLQTNEYMMTLILAKKMLELLKPSHRPHDKCECHIMIAIACYKAGDASHALEELDTAFGIAKRYHYVRLFADEGQVMVELLKLYKTYADAENYDEKYVKEIRGTAVEVARVLPSYLQTEELKEFALTKTERLVLDRMAEGLSNEDIGLDLGKKEGTIKYHTASIFRKFGVANRQQAINFARSKGMIN